MDGNPNLAPLRRSSFTGCGIEQATDGHVPLGGGFALEDVADRADCLQRNLQQVVTRPDESEISTPGRLHLVVRG